MDLLVALPLVLALLVLVSFTSTARADLYWVDSGSIGHSTNSGGDADGAWLTSPDVLGGGIAVTAEHLYWTGWNGQIWRANRDGTGIQEIVSDATNPTSLAIDAQYLYWTNGSTDTIGRAPLGGGPAENAFIATGDAPTGIAVDGAHVFWSNNNSGSIGRADKDGGAVTNSLVTGLNSPRGMTLDGGYVYWASFYGNRVGRAKLDGTAVESNYYNVGYNLWGVAIAGGALYWTESGFGDIGRLNLTSRASTYVFEDGFFPTGIVATGPGFSAAPTTGAFGNVNLSRSASQTFTITNAPGSGPAESLAFTANAVTLTGTNANQFAKTADTCAGRSIASGASCTVTVAFTPTSTGAKSANLRLVDNAASSPQTLALSGRGTQATFSAAPTALDLGSAGVGGTGTASAVTVTNAASGANAGSLTIPAGGVTLSGSDPSQFTIMADGCSGQTLAPAATCTVRVAVAPTSPGTKSASLRFADDATGAPHTVTLGGLGRAPAVALDPGTLDFGGVLAGHTSAPRTITVTNSATGSGADDLVFGATAATLSGPDAGRFAIADDECAGRTLAPSEHCAISVSFTPGTTGARTAVLELADNAPGSPQQVALSGTGTGPAASLSSTSLDFGDQTVGTTSAPGSVTVTNTGDQPLKITGMTRGGAGGSRVTATRGCGTDLIAPGDTCVVSVTFSPTAVGTLTPTLTLSGNFGSAVIDLSGTGIAAAPELSITPGSLDFGSVRRNTTSAPQTFTVTNTGTASLKVNGVTRGGTGGSRITVTNDCLAIIAPGGSCTLSVTFSPTALGTLTPTLSITSNGGSAILGLSGTGV
jgi:hypothetical protein